MATAKQILDRLADLERVYKPDTSPFAILRYDPSDRRGLEARIKAERSSGRAVIFAIPHNGR